MIKSYYNKVKAIIVSCETKEQLKGCIDMVERYYETCKANNGYHHRDIIKYNTGKLMGILEYKKDILCKTK